MMKNMLPLLALLLGAALLTRSALAQAPEQPGMRDPGLAAAGLFEKELPGLAKIGQLKAVPSSLIVKSNISIGFECLDRFIFDPEKCYDKLAETGTKWARCQTGWSRCETVKGTYDFKWLDEVVDNLRSRGVQPWFNVGFGNTLYMTNTFTAAAVGCVPLYYGHEAQQAWQAYIRALSRHFKGRVSHWEIWNEPNIDAFWQPKKADPLAYLELIKLTGGLIREEVPGAKVGACLSGVLNDYVKRLITAGVGKEIDFFAVHAYSVQPEQGYRSEIATLRRLFDENGGKAVRLWQGESGFASWFPPNHWLHPTVMESEANQAKWLLRRFITDARAGMELSSFFQMVDMTARPYSMAKTTQANPARHGILHGNTYERKRSFHALGHYNTLFDGDTVLTTNLSMTVDMGGARVPTNCVSRVPVTAGFRRKGVPLYVYYLTVDIQAGYAGLPSVQAAVTGDTEEPIRNPVLVDLLKGGVYAIKEVVRTQQGCVGFKNLPLTDYPLVITDRSALEGRLVAIP
jgi:hypothetical protein